MSIVAQALIGRITMKIGTICSAILSNSIGIAASSRQFSIRNFHPKTTRRVQALCCRDNRPNPDRCKIYREKGIGSIATIVIGGFMPDATEAVEFQRDLFRKSGDIYYMNFPRNDFCLEMFHAELGDLIEDLNNRGDHPTLFCISFGSGLAVEFLSDKLLTANLHISGCVFVSPVMCLEDLIRLDTVKTGKRRAMESILKRILESSTQKHDDVKRHIEKGRRYFLNLIEAGVEQRALSYRHLSIKNKILDVITKTTSQAGHKRILALKTFNKPGQIRHLYGGPILMLVAEREEEIFTSTSPTLAFLKNHQYFREIFPRGIVKLVSSGKAKDPVPHASLIFHHQHYNPILNEWLSKTRLPYPILRPAA
jgi:hypothetical protein